MPNVYPGDIILNLTDEAFKNKKLVRALEQGTLKEALADPGVIAALEEIASKEAEQSENRSKRSEADTKKDLQELRESFKGLLPEEMISEILDKDDDGG